ncbi:hypothetical protein RHMOL_Rhmol05G0170400 [Rhododendron molle]|nr:hypothetical protein RHMOL_Rhmol05G0170400 [Rhododendron molle]
MPHYHYHLHYNYALAIATVLLSFSLQLAQCQLNDDYNPTLLPLLIQAVYGRLSDLTSTILSAPFTKNASFCIKDPEVEWDRAFNYSSNLTFVSSCIQKTNGDMPLRLCTAAEAKFYFNNFVGGASGVLLNKYCNLTSWVPGCKPGWACSVNLTVQEACPLGSYYPLATLNEATSMCDPHYCWMGSMYEKPKLLAEL